MHFGGQVKEARTLQRISIIELAKLVNVTEAYIINLENGKIQNPSFFKLMNIAKALNLDVYQLKNRCYDPDWMKLMKEANVLGLTIEEVRQYIKKKSLVEIK
jgi:transcriptional regulator with XRE-family HTH domain